MTGGIVNGGGLYVVKSNRQRRWLYTRELPSLKRSEDVGVSALVTNRSPREVYRHPTPTPVNHTWFVSDPGLCVRDSGERVRGPRSGNSDHRRSRVGEGFQCRFSVVLVTDPYVQARTVPPLGMSLFLGFY